MLKVNRFLAIIALVFFVVSCGGGGGGGESIGDNIPIINPVSAAGQVDGPSSISPSTLTVITGISSKTVNSDGSFTIDLNKDNTNLVVATNLQGNPVLMSTVIKAKTGLHVPLNVQSTAETLIYLSPGVTQSNPTDAQTIMSYIKSLPETTTLANLLSSKLTVNPNILSTDDHEIKAAISKALSALIVKVRSSSGLSAKAKGTSLITGINAQTINPPNASGLFLSFDNSTNTLSVKNCVKRYVDLYVVSPHDKFLFRLDSVSVLEAGVKSYLSDIGLQTDFCTKKSVVLPSPTNAVIKAYGLGFHDLTNVWNNMTQSDKERLIPPVSITAVFDFMVPILSVIIGVDVSTCVAQTLITLTQDVMDNYGDAFIYMLETGNKKDFAEVVIGAVYDRLSTNGYALFKELLRECGFTVKEMAITILKAIFHIERIISGGEVLGSAISLYARAMETFTLAPDTTPPSLVSSSPPNGATNVSVTNRTISFTFNEPMMSNGNYSVLWSTNIDANKFTSITWSSDKKTVYFTYSENFPVNSTITWRLNPSTYPLTFKDLAGNTLPADTYYGSFTTSPSALTKWTISNIDSGIGVTSMSIVVDSNNKVHIGYTGAWSNLKYATNASGIWKTSTIEDSVAVRLYSSIAVDSNNKAHISYCEGGISCERLKYATNASGRWVISTIDSTGYDVGYGTSIAVDSNNNVHISYIDRSIGGVSNTQQMPLAHG